MSFKDYLTKKNIVVKNNNSTVVQETVKKTTKIKKLSDYSTEELYEELNKRENNKKKEILELKSNPTDYASMILEDSTFDNSKVGSTNKLNNNENIMSHAMDIL